MVAYLRDKGLTAEQLSDGEAGSFSVAFSSHDATTENGPRTLTDTIQTYGPSLIDGLSLIKAIQTGEPLPVAVSGLRLAASIDLVNGEGIDYDLSAASSLGSGILSLMSLNAALERGDELGAISSGAQSVFFTATAFSEFATSQAFAAVSNGGMDLAAESLALQSQVVADSVGKAIPYLSLVNSIANGDEVGVVSSAMMLYPPLAPLGIAISIARAIFSLFGDDDVPDPWGSGRYVWEGDGIGYRVSGETGGDRSVKNVMSGVVATMNALIERERALNPGAALGIIPNRMPNVGYDMSGYRYTDLDPLTGEERHAGLRYDTGGRPYNAEPGSPESYWSISEAMIRSALARGAIAPEWEVRTARMQSAAGDPRAGLTEEERAGRDGKLAAPVSGDSQIFRPVALDLDGDGIETVGRASSGVAFDVDDSGFLKSTGWLRGDDAFLTLDRNYNGRIDSGREMFSNGVVDLSRRGLAGMAWVDANRDGRLTSADPVWNELGVWRDANGDGVASDAERHTLAELGITELNYAMGRFVQRGVVRELGSPNLEADAEGVRVNVVPEGIVVQGSEGEISLLVTRIDDLTVVEANRDGASGYEDIEMIFSAADLLANDTLGGFLGRDLTLAGLTHFRHGSGWIDANGFVHFQPEADYFGDDAGFDYIVRAVNGQKGTGTVELNIQGVNDAPTLAGMTPDQRAVYGYTPIRYWDSDGFRSYWTGGNPIYEPYAINPWGGDGWYWGYEGEIVYNPAPDIWWYDYRDTPIAYEATGGWIVGADPDDPAGSLRYELVNQPQYGEVTLGADGAFEYVSWKEPNVPSDYIVVDGEYAALKDGTLYTSTGLPSPGVYPTTDVFEVRITDPSGASSIHSITVPHYGPYLPPPPPGGGGKKPIAVDLDGDGFAFTAVDDSNLFMDVNGDGWRERMAWTAPGDGVLAFDANGDGVIDRIDEVSFVGYKEGAQTDLEGLAAFDTNGDGRFSSADERWGEFGVWRDANGNGVTDPGEFVGLDAMGVASVSLTSDGRFQVIDDQTVHGIGTMRMKDGRSLDLADVTLAYSNEVLVTRPDGTTDVAWRPDFSPDGEVLAGSLEDDLILGKSGNNVVYGYAGDDVVFEDGGNDVIDGGDGDDMIYSGADDDVVMGGTGDDAIYGGLGDDLLFGGDGHDAILAEGGNDVAFGGAGNDLIAGGAGNDLLSGDDGDDMLFGESGTDVLFGRDGDDELHGMEHNDLLYGGAGNDVLDGGSGIDEMIGGAGDDTYAVDHTGDVVTELAGEGVDTVHSSIDYTLSGNLEHLTLVGDKALRGIGNYKANRIVGNAGDNVLRGEAGDDDLDGGAGADRLYGGTGNDVYRVDSSGDRVVEYAGEGRDTVRATLSYTLGAHLERLVLDGSENLRGEGNALDNDVIGNAGDNVIDGGGGADWMSGRGGDDLYIVDNAGDKVVEWGGSGIDTVRSGIDYVLPANVENLALTGGADIDGTGNGLANVIVGNAGDNVIDGGGGADRMSGGGGDDRYVVDNVGDRVVEFAGAGVDEVHSSVSFALSANVENLTLTGGADIDGTGNGLANVIVGNVGDNVINGGGGADRMAGGGGDDRYVVDNVGDRVVEFAGAGVDEVHSSVSFALSANVENLTLTGGADIDGTGNGLANVIVGNVGDNVINGGGGADRMSGGGGDDRYIVDNAGDEVVEWAEAGTDEVRSSVSYVLPDHVENLVLTGTADIDGTGNGVANVIVGNVGNNLLRGLAGDDRIDGQDGNDQVEGGIGADRLSGGAGADLLVGGDGDDRIEGGAGDDAFVYRLGDDLDRVSDAAGVDEVRFGEGISFDTVAIRLTEFEGVTTAHLRILNAGGCEMEDQGIDFELDTNGRSPIESFLFADGSRYSIEDLLIRTEYFHGTPKDAEIRTGRHDDIIYAGPAVNTIHSGTGNDIVYAEQQGDTLYGEGGDDYLLGDEGDDVLDGACGDDILDGGNGNDELRDFGGGNALLIGGQGDDVLSGGDGNDLIIGARHDDILDGGAGYNIFAFNEENGRDVILPSAGAINTLSLGAVDYRTLEFSRAGDDLVFDVDASSRITFLDWYADEAARNFATLQVVERKGAVYDYERPFGALVETFDFRALVDHFDRDATADPGLDRWSLMNGLLDAHLASSDTSAVGGDLAFHYGYQGGLAGMGVDAARDSLESEGFGQRAQSVRSWSTVDYGLVKLS